MQVIFVGRWQCLAATASRQQQLNSVCTFWSSLFGRKQSKHSPPVPVQEPGSDEYRWMQAMGGHMLQHLQQEEQHTAHVFKSAGVYRTKQDLLTELTAAFDTPQASLPERLGPYYYQLLPDESYVRWRAHTLPPGCDDSSKPSSHDSSSLAATTSICGGNTHDDDDTSASCSTSQEVLLDAGSVMRDVQEAGRVLGRALNIADIRPQVMRLSRCQQVLAYTLPLQPGLTHGSEASVALVRDLAHGSLLGGARGCVEGVASIELCGGGPSSAANAAHGGHASMHGAVHGLIYTVPEDGGRPHQVYLRALTGIAPREEHQAPSGVAGNDVAACSDRLLLSEPSPAHYIVLGRCKDWSFITINITAKTSSEVHLLSATDPWGSPLLLVQPRAPGIEYFVEHQAGQLYILTNAAFQQHQLPSSSSNHKSAHQASELESATSATSAASQGSMGVQCTAAMHQHCAAGVELVVATAPVSTPGLAHWRVLLEAQPGMAMTDMDMFAGHLVLYARMRGLPSVLTLPLPQPGSADGSFEGPCNHRLVQVVLPAWAMHITPGINQDLHAACLRLIASSPLHPPTVMEYAFQSRQLTQLVSEPVPHHVQQLLSSCSLYYDPEGAVSHDGVHVPVTLVLPGSLTDVSPGGSMASVQQHPDQRLRAWEKACAPREGMQVLQRLWDVSCTADGGSSTSTSTSINSQAAAQSCAIMELSSTASPLTAHGSTSPPASGPVLVQVYGAYGTPLELAYDPSLLPLLARGWTVAKAHVRGGGEHGRRWHASGRQLHKPSSVADLWAVLMRLRAAGFGPITASTVSAGGVVLGAVIAASRHARVPLLHAAVLRCALLDLGTTSTHSHLPLTVHEYEEWGDPSQPGVMHMLQRLCPYAALAPQTPQHNHAHEQQTGVPITAASALPQAPPFPTVLASCAVQDARVPAWVLAKWIARYRRLACEQPPPNPSCPVHSSPPASMSRSSMPASAVSATAASIPLSRVCLPPGTAVLRVHAHGGHVRPPEEQLEEAAEELAFLLHAAGSTGTSSWGAWPGQGMQRHSFADANCVC